MSLTEVLPTELLEIILSECSAETLRCLCLTHRSMNDTIKGNARLVLRSHRRFNNDHRQYEFLDRLDRKNPELLRRVLRVDHHRSLDPHVAVMFAVTTEGGEYVSDVFDRLLATEEIDRVLRGVHLFQAACMCLDVQRPDHTRAFSIIAARTRSSPRHFARRSYYGGLMYYGLHPVMCAAINKHAGGVFEMTLRWYEDRFGTAYVRDDLWKEVFYDDEGLNHVSNAIDSIYSDHPSSASDAALARLKRVIALPGAEEYIERRSVQLLRDLVNTDRADVLEYLVRQSWLDIGASDIAAMTPLAYVVCSVSRYPSRSAALKRMASALVRASVARRDDGSGVNQFLPSDQMNLLHLAVTTGDLELTQILLSHPLCNPRRVCRFRNGARGGRADLVNAAELAARLGFTHIQHAIEIVSRTPR